MDNREGLHQYKNLKFIYEPYANLFIIQSSEGIIILIDAPGTNPKPKSQPPKTLNLRDQSKLITKRKSNLWALEINSNQQTRYPQFSTGEKSIDEKQLFEGSIEKKKTARTIFFFYRD